MVGLLIVSHFIRGADLTQRQTILGFAWGSEHWALSPGKPCAYKALQMGLQGGECHTLLVCDPTQHFEDVSLQVNIL